MTTVLPIARRKESWLTVTHSYSSS